MAVGLMTLVLGAISLFSLWHTPGVAEHSILQITLDGAIPEVSQPQVSRLLGGEEEVPLVTLVERIRRAAEDKRIDGLLLHVKAPEVGLAQAEELGRAMQVFRA